VKNANSLAFVDGVPIFERFFLGDEFTIRGYNVRSISPVAPVDSFITSQNVSFASNASGTPVPITGLPASALSLGMFTGQSGSNVVSLPRTSTSIGGDTQLLGNFEYRIPIITYAVSIAAFADIGSAFNLRSKGTQTFSSNFLDDQPFLSTVGVVPCPRFATGFAKSVLVLLRFAKPTARCVTLPEPRRSRQSNCQPVGAGSGGNRGNKSRYTFTDWFQPVFLRGQAQTNSVVNLSESLFAKIGDYRSSLGMEVSTGTHYQCTVSLNLCV
jgi:outer membrane protein insertion porin family